MTKKPTPRDDAHRSAPGHDPVVVVEAAYDLASTDAEWLERLTAAIGRELDEGHGMTAFLVAPDPGGGARARDPVVLGGPARWQASWRETLWDELVARLPPDVLAAWIAFAPVTYSSHANYALAHGHAVAAELARELAGRGYRHLVEAIVGPDAAGAERGRPEIVRWTPPDALAIVAADPSGHAACFFANRATRAARPVTRAIRRTWSRVAAHIASAHRVRRRLVAAEVAADPIRGAEAVLEPGGRVVHAEGPAAQGEARAALRRAAIDVDRARTRKLRSSDEALELWRALHEGRWAIADAFDRDGRRFLVARANEPAAAPAPSLSRREQQVLDLLALGQSNKQISYALGISPSSVATHLGRAAAKVGLGSTRALVRWARARPRPREA